MYTRGRDDGRGIDAPWSFRLAEATRAPLLLVGLGVAVVYLLFFVLFHNATGGLDGLRIGGQLFWLNPFGALAFTYSLGFAYLLIVVSHLMRFALARLRDLQPVLTLSASEIAEFDSGLRRIEPWRLRLVGVVGVGVMTLLNVWFLSSVGPESRPQPWSSWVVFVIAQDVVYSWMTVRVMAFFFVVGLRFSRLGERHTVIDLFDFRGVRPFTRLGLRLALVVLIGFAVNTPSMAGLFTVTDVGLLVAYVGGLLVGVPVIVGAILVMLPLRGVHRAIVRTKTSDLERVRAEVAGEREAIDSGDEERKTAAAQRLPGLLAYEARVERVREWSLDFPAFLRFALYVLIPLGSWVAAAFVERALGAALE